MVVYGNKELSVNCGRFSVKFTEYTNWNFYALKQNFRQLRNCVLN